MNQEINKAGIKDGIVELYGVEYYTVGFGITPLTTKKQFKILKKIKKLCS